MDRRWQLVLDCLDADQPPFSRGTFVAFRKRLIDAQIDRRLIEQTIELASQTQEFGSRALRAALDSSPLWGAGRVEDTYNLIGHALKKTLRLVAKQRGEAVADVGQEAGVELVCGPSLKAASTVIGIRLGSARKHWNWCCRSCERWNLGYRRLSKKRWSWLSHPWRLLNTSRRKMCRLMRTGRQA
jgi:hypothetical protein